MISTDFVFTRFSLFFRTAILRSIPFQEDAARIERAGACPGVATVETVVVGERVALVTGVMVLVCNGGIRNGLKNLSHRIVLLKEENGEQLGPWVAGWPLLKAFNIYACDILLPYVQLNGSYPLPPFPQKSQP